MTQLMRQDDDLLTREARVFDGTGGPGEDLGCAGGLLKVFALDIYWHHVSAQRSCDGDGGIEYIYRDVYDCHQLVNRSDGVVERVYVAGKKVWQGTGFTENIGRERAGRALTATG